VDFCFFYDGPPFAIDNTGFVGKRKNGESLMLFRVNEATLNPAL